ncbi:MAG: hypothetical protein P9L98_01575 [Candidatus Kaelpia imicola]|nr:hypothetical protein [Candidatus Kaelpia imicola]
MRENLGPIEQSMVISALQGELRSSFELESLKGRDVTIYPEPVCLEAPFQPYELKSFLREGTTNVCITPERFTENSQKAYLRLWFSPKDEIQWIEFETLLRELSIIKNPIEFLLIGNKERISCQISINRADEKPVKSAIKSKFSNIEIDVNEENYFLQILQQTNTINHTFDIRDFYPIAPYWKSLSGYEGIKISPLMPIYSALSELKQEFGFYQVTFKRVTHDWRENIINLTEAELQAGQFGSLQQNLISHAGFGSDYYKEARKKLDSPLFCVSIRIGACCRNENIRGVLDSLSLPIAGFQYGKREFNYLAKADYLRTMENKKIIEMIVTSLIYRNGMLLSSTELSALCNSGSKEIMERKDFSLDKAVGFKAIEQTSRDGVLLGYNDFAGKKVPVFQPTHLRNKGTIIGGITGSGKSILMENMFLADINNGEGAGYIDYHGDAIERIKKQIPKERVRDVCYYNPCDKDFIISHNFFSLGKNEDAGKKVNDLLDAIKGLYSAKDWGSQIEATLMPVLYTLLKGNLTLTDVRGLLSKSKEGYKLRQSVAPIIENKEIQMFWHDFEKIPNSTLQRVVSKLSKFLLQERIYRIFSQRDNRLNFRNIIDNKKIFLAYFPAGLLGSNCSNILGSIIYCSFFHAALSRQDIVPSQRVGFNLYIDEAQRLSVNKKAFEDSLRECRKFNLRLIFGFQQKEMMAESIKTAFGNVQTVVALDLDWDDSQNLFKEFFGEVEINDFMRKGVGKAFVKKGNEIINISTPEPNKITGNGFSEEIDSLTREKYCVSLKKNIATVRRAIERPSDNENLYDEI